MIRIFLMRHGVSEANEERQITLHVPDHAVNLSAAGRGQAAAAGAELAAYLAANPGEGRLRLWNSPYWRTRQTADAVADAFRRRRFGEKPDDAAPSPADPGMPFFDRRESPLVVEQQFGMFDGYEDGELKERFPAEFAAFDKHRLQEGRYYARMPMGESRFDVSVRVHQFFGTLLRDAEGAREIRDVVVVSHGVTVRAFAMMWLHLSPEWFDREPNPGNCSVRLIAGERGDYRDRGYIIGAPGATRSEVKGR